MRMSDIELEAAIMVCRQRHRTGQTCTPEFEKLVDLIQKELDQRFYLKVHYD